VPPSPYFLRKVFKTDTLGLHLGHKFLFLGAVGLQSLLSTLVKLKTKQKPQTDSELLFLRSISSIAGGMELVRHAIRLI
jgi:hypothetical protein